MAPPTLQQLKPEPGNGHSVIPVVGGAKAQSTPSTAEGLNAEGGDIYSRSAKDSGASAESDYSVPDKNGPTKRGPPKTDPDGHSLFDVDETVAVDPPPQPHVWEIGEHMLDPSTHLPVAAAADEVVVGETTFILGEGGIITGEFPTGFGGVAGAQAGVGAGAIEVGAGAAEVSAEAVGETALLGAGTAVGEILGAAAIGVGALAVAATVVIGILCATQTLPSCKKRVCVDPRGRWHSHKSHCPEDVGCYDKNNQWHRHHKHCTNQKCQGPDGWWHHNSHHCHVYGCHDPNGDWHEHSKHCDPKHFKCQGPAGRWHKHKKHCKRSRDQAIAERDVAFANAVPIQQDNSYIVITNAHNFNHEELNVLKGMVILPDDDDHSTHAFFEKGDLWSIEGYLSKVEPSSGIHAGNLTFEYPHGENKQVEGKFLTADPSSNDPKVRQVLKEIKDAHQHPANAQ